MTATIILFPSVPELVAQGTTEELCPCCGLPKVFRSTSEIWADLMPLRMTGPEDADLRQDLIAELQEALVREDGGVV